MLKQGLHQKLLQKLSPQQIQLMKLLQLPTIELEQRIKEEMENNPALEEGREEASSQDEYGQDDGYDDQGNDDRSEGEKEFDFSDYMDDDTPSYKLSARQKGSDQEDKTIPISLGKTFHEQLETQIGLKKLNERELAIAHYLIGSLDDSGYLRRELPSVADDLAFSQNVMVSVDEIEAVLTELQQLDPPGIAARDLRECLLLQLKRKPLDYVIKTAIHILEEHFEEFTKKHYDRILKKTELDNEDLKEAIDVILKLNPKPGGSVNEASRNAQHITPDFIITINDGELELTINGRNAPDLKINRSYREMMEGYTQSKKKPEKAQKDALVFVKQKLDAAKWFIDAIKQRQETLLHTMTAIMEKQREYFLEGDEVFLKPMILKDIAEMVGLDISTISRVVNSKYVLTPYGTFLLKDFFSESISTQSGEEVSNKEVKKILKDLISAEDKRKPITDDRLSELLKEKGYNIARRTVAKYREQLNIPVARLRKEL
jgi:RNA polymerase sigma-54 factor